MNMAWSPDGQRIAIGDRTDNLSIFDAAAAVQMSSEKQPCEVRQLLSRRLTPSDQRDRLLEQLEGSHLRQRCEQGRSDPDPRRARLDRGAQLARQHVGPAHDRHRSAGEVRETIER